MSFLLKELFNAKAATFAGLPMKNRPWHRYLTFALFAAAIYFPLFHHLTWEPIHNWDESLFAMRAGYMAEEGKYLPDYNHWIAGGPMHRNTKPPFTTWIQALFMKIFGISEFGLRLPIALFSLATVFLFLFVSKKLLGNIYIGYCAGFILATSAGYVKAHAARTGDQDAALAFYMLAGAFFFYKYIESATVRQRHKWLALLTFSLIASVLTKYVFGLFFLPAFVIYALHKKEFLNILKRGSTWLAAFAVISVAGVWLVVIDRELPGFIERAFFYEMVDRYASTIENHAAPWHYYFNKMWETRFVPWVYLLPVPLVMLFMKKYRPWRDVILLLFLCALSLLLIVAFSQTKTVHYDIVAYPALSLLAGIGMYQLLHSARELATERKHVLLLLFMVLYLAKPFFIDPYAAIIDKTYTPKLTQPNLKYGYLFRKLKNRKKPVKNFTLIHPGFDGQAIFYAGLYNRKMGYDINISINPEQVKPGDTIMVCDKPIIKYLFDHWELQGIEAYDQCFLAAVLHEKKDKTAGE